MSEPALASNDDDPHFDRLLALMHATFSAAARLPLFTTDAERLMDSYLAGFPESGRQYHTCNACRKFLEQFGGLVTIDDEGRTHSAVWPAEGVPAHYAQSVAAVRNTVLLARVTGVFLSDVSPWGLPANPKSAKQGPGDWTHLHLLPAREHLYSGLVLTPGQAMAQKREDRGTVLRGLAEFSRDTVATAVKLLSAEDALYRSEKVLGPAEWLLRLHDQRATPMGKDAREHLTWLAVAQAPEGFCHPRSSMIGTLLEDIENGMSFDVAAKRFAAKMHPLRYQRPQAAPSVGNIQQAEKIVETLGIANSLRRRYARLDEIHAFWRPPAPQPEPPKTGGVFSHLTPKGTPEAQPLELPSTKITWDKFQRQVLPTAQKIECEPPTIGNFGAIITAVDLAAPPILQWDREDRRNPFSWYLRARGSPRSEWGLGGWTVVDAITFRPSTWFDGNEHHGQGVYLILHGAKDALEAHACLFPETLRSELHGVRSTIEAFSQAAKMEGGEEATACGLILRKGHTDWNARLRVTDRDGDVREYILDRWD